MSPTEVRLQWSALPLIDHNGIITHYEVFYNQSTHDYLPLYGTVVSSVLSAIVDPLQPFTPYTLTVRAHTNQGAGPYTSDPVITMSDPTGTHTHACIHAYTHTIWCILYGIH